MALNGRLYSWELATIPGTSRRVYKPLVTQVHAFRQAFEYKFGKPLVVTDAYRSYEEQESLFRSRYTTTYLAGRPYKIWNNVRWYQKPYTAMAAVPGTSNHGWGTALDLGSGVNSGPNTREHDWAEANAPRFGFRWPSEWAYNASEWWHFEDGSIVPVSNYVKFPGVNIDVNTGDLPDPITEIDMLADERNMLFHIGALLDQTPVRTAQQVWNQQVSRYEGNPSTIFSDIVEGNTAAIEARNAVPVLQAEIAGLRAAINALALANGSEPEEIAAVITSAVKSAIADSQFTSVTTTTVVNS